MKPAKKYHKSLKGFTLVELIVVISILAILGTIAFISLQGYSASSRNSVRISDASNMKRSLDLFHVNAGKYPLPDDYETVSYNLEDLRYQGNFGNTVVSNLSRNMSKVPIDPLTGKKYIFSIANNKNEFQILTLLEGGIALNMISQTNADTLSVMPKVDGNYNGVFIKTSKNIVPIPSIITSENIGVGAGLTLNSTNIKSQVTNLGKNIPNIGNVNYNTGALTGLKLITYTGSINKDSSDSDKEAAMLAIQASYTGSELVNDDKIKYILSKTTKEELVALANMLLLHSQNVLKSGTLGEGESTLDFIFSNYTGAGDGTAIQIHNIKPGQVGDAIKLNNNQALVTYNSNLLNAGYNYVKSISWNLDINNNLTVGPSSSVVYSSQQALYPSLSKINDTKAVFSAYENGPTGSEWLILKNLEVSGNTITQKTRNVGTTTYTSHPGIYTDGTYSFVSYGTSTMSLYTESNDIYTQRKTFSIGTDENYLGTRVRKVGTNKYIAFLRTKLITFSVNPITYDITIHDTLSLPLHYTFGINQVSDTKFMILYDDLANNINNHLLIGVDLESLSIGEINTLSYPGNGAGYGSSTMIEQNRFVVALGGYLYETILNENTLSTQQISSYETRRPLLNGLIPLDNSKVLFFYGASDNTFKAKIMDLNK